MREAADSIRRGLKGAVAYAAGKAEESAYRIHVPEKIDVKAIRTRLDMTQEEFAGRFGFSVNTLRYWEQGSRQPEGPMRACRLVIERASEGIISNHPVPSAAADAPPRRWPRPDRM